MAGLEKLLTAKETLKMMEKQLFELCYPASLLPD